MMKWTDEDTAENKDHSYSIHYNQFMQPKPYRCLAYSMEYNSPLFQVGLMTQTVKEAKEYGDEHNYKLIES